MIVLLEDECHLVWGDVCGMVWGKRNTPIEVPMTNERERQTYYGAINLLTNTVHLQERAGRGWGQYGGVSAVVSNALP